MAAFVALNIQKTGRFQKKFEENVYSYIYTIKLAFRNLMTFAPESFQARQKIE